LLGKGKFKIFFENKNISVVEDIQFEDIYVFQTPLVTFAEPKANIPIPTTSHYPLIISSCPFVKINKPYIIVCAMLSRLSK
jgi:hypothetical protein